MYVTVRCDILPGKEEVLDRYLAEKAKPFWASQPGVIEFHVYGDALVGWPERTIAIEMDSFATLQDVLRSDEFRRLRSEFMTYTTDVQSQILEKIV